MLSSSINTPSAPPATSGIDHRILSIQALRVVFIGNKPRTSQQIASTAARRRRLKTCYVAQVESQAEGLHCQVGEIAG